MFTDRLIIVTGANGQLGYDVCKRLKEANFTNVLGIDIQDLDLTDKEATIEFIEKRRPAAVVHCAAFTAVDKAESEPEKCELVNVEGTRNIAIACKIVDAKMVYISTEYVFDGKGEEPYEIDSQKNPLSVYGRTKSQGEEVVKQILKKYFIVRISWAFGVNGNNFVKTMLKIASKSTHVNVVDDQIGSPTYTYDLARLIVAMIPTKQYGVYHATNEGYCSWYEFAKEIFRLLRVGIDVIPVSTEEYRKAVPNQAVRPHNSRLSKDSLDNGGFLRLPPWENALKRFLIEFAQYKKEHKSL